MEPGFACEIVGQEEDVLEVQVSASNGVFEGRTRLYAPEGALADAAGQLTGFPGHPDDTRILLLGAFGPEFAGGGVSLAFSLADETGRAHVQVVIEADGEVAGITETVTLALPFDLPALDAFIKELRRVETEGTGRALLKGVA